MTDTSLIVNLERFAELIRIKRDSLLDSWRNEIRRLPNAKELSTPALNDHIPLLLDELADALCRQHAKPLTGESLDAPTIHGTQRFEVGFDIVEVVAEFNVLRECLQNLAEQNNVNTQGAAGHIVNRLIDDATGVAVQTFAAQQAEAVKERRQEHLAFVAHDLKTPLASIHIAAKLLESNLSAEMQQENNRKLMNTLQRNVARMDALINKVVQEEVNINTEDEMNLVRREFDLWTLVESLIDDLRPLALKTETRLVNDIPEDLQAYADANQLTQVFQNLLDNAIAHTPRGEISITARALDATGAIECQVTDDGEGITAEFLPRVFDKLETTSLRKDSTGLGLAIVKQIIEAHGGEISVESELRKGTTFRFNLPGKPNDDLLQK